MTQSDVLDTVWQIIQKILGSSYRVYLYGSRAKGTPDPESDFDLLIWGSDKVPEVKWLTLKSEVENLKTLYKIDLVDYHQMSEDFRRVVQSHFKEIVNGKIRT